MSASTGRARDARQGSSWQDASEGVNPNEVIELAAEALALTRNGLAMRYRFLDRALWKMALVPTPQVSLVGSDTRKLYYNPTDVLRRFASSRDELARDLLHTVFHCVFYHPFISNDIDQGLWDLSCDIVCEAACIELAGKALRSDRDGERTRAIEALEDALGNLSPEKLYVHFETGDVPDDELFFLDALFIRDEHGLWYTSRGGETAEPQEGGAIDDSSAAAMGGASAGGDDASAQMDAGEQDGGVDEGADSADEDADADGADGGDGDGSGGRVDGDGEAARFDDESRQEWEHISKRMRVEMKNAPDEHGTSAGALAMRLQIANRERHDYREFLARFAELHEEMRLNMDEFDLIYYRYGIDRYGNVPLIEPLEYADSVKVRTFVIAIDTSESVQGGLVKRFLEETWSVLSETSSFFEECRVRIIQCDARVQSDVEVCNREQFDAYLEDFEVLGMGGTDFRPVFEHVDALVEQGELEGLRGLVYFTDGKGTYPTSPPDYETVFAFIDDGHEPPAAPPWAYRLMIDEFQLSFHERGLEQQGN